MTNKEVLTDSFQVTPEGIFIPRESHSMTYLCDELKNWILDVEFGNRYVSKKKREILYDIYFNLSNIAYPATYIADKIVNEND